MKNENDKTTTTEATSKGLISKIYKQLINSISEIQTIQSTNRQKT